MVVMWQCLEVLLLLLLLLLRRPTLVIICVIVRTADASVTIPVAFSRPLPFIALRWILQLLLVVVVAGRSLIAWHRRLSRLLTVLGWQYWRLLYRDDRSLLPLASSLRRSTWVTRLARVLRSLQRSVAVQIGSRQNLRVVRLLLWNIRQRLIDDRDRLR